MTQRLSICQWRRPLALFGLGLSFAVAAPAYGESPSLRHTTTVLAIQRAEPAVVNIEGNKPAGGSSTRGDAAQVNGMGAGVIIDERGYILTNQHVVQDVNRIEVTLNDGTKYVAKLIAIDAKTDLALIKIDAAVTLPVVPCGTSSDLMRGEPVIAIGNPFGYHHTVTEGIISALHRDIPVNGVQDYPDLIQTDASINPGNSGGPLLNADGMMIGINAAVRIGAQGIGFAIPVDRASEVAAEMIAEHRGSRFTSPIAVQTEYQHGGSQAIVARAGNNDLRQGDIVRSVGERRVKNRLEYELALLDYNSTSTVPIVVQRDDQEFELSLASGRSTASTSTRLASTTSKPAPQSSVQDTVYRLLGLQLAPADGAKVRRVDSSYKGGLVVVAVKPNSAAERADIKPGDILVGLLEWQTPDWEDLAWILKSRNVQANGSTKFHIMRGSEVFWGTL